MFGLDKLKDFKKNAEEVKARLETIQVEGKAGDNLVRVTCTGARTITNVSIDNQVLRTGEKETIEKLVKEACNDALKQADDLAGSEMRGIMPNIPGLGG